MPLDALTTQRIRALEIVLSWLIGQSIAGGPEYVPEFVEAAQNPTYILELAEKIGESLEEEE